jgi:hypothetical protein
MKTSKSEKTKKLIPSYLIGCGAEEKEPEKKQIQYADYC